MHTVHISGPATPGSASVGTQLSSPSADRGSERFALHFEKAGQKPPLIASRSRPEDHADALSGTEAPESPATEDGAKDNGAREPGQERGDNAGLAANALLIRKDGSPGLLTGEQTKTSKKAARNEQASEPDAHSHQAVLQEGSTSLSGLENQGAHPASSIPTLDGSQGVSGRYSLHMSTINRNAHAVAGGTAHTDPRAAISASSQGTGSLPAGKGAIAGNQAVIATANGLPDITAPRIADMLGAQPLDNKNQMGRERLATAENQVRVSSADASGPAGLPGVGLHDPMFTALKQGLAKTGSSLSEPLTDHSLRQMTPRREMTDGQSAPLANTHNSVWPSGIADIPGTTFFERTHFIHSPGSSLHEDGGKTALISDDESIESILALLPRSSFPAAPVEITDAAFARAQTARSVAAQMAAALSGAHNSKVEITLNPEELGRVRMSLSTTDTGITVSIIAERPETLDMMRRHIHFLAEEFSNLGYENIGFEFSGDESQGRADKDTADSQPDDRAMSDNHPDTSEPGPLPIARAGQSRGLDMRL